MGTPVYLWRGSGISADFAVRLDNTNTLIYYPKTRMPYIIIRQIYSTPEWDCSKSKDRANWQEEIFDPGRN